MDGWRGCLTDGVLVLRPAYSYTSVDVAFQDCTVEGVQFAMLSQLPDCLLHGRPALFHWVLPLIQDSVLASDAGQQALWESLRAAVALRDPDVVCAVIRRGADVHSAPCQWASDARRRHAEQEFRRELGRTSDAVLTVIGDTLAEFRTQVVALLGPSLGQSPCNIITHFAY